MSNIIIRGFVCVFAHFLWGRDVVHKKGSMFCLSIGIYLSN